MSPSYRSVAKLTVLKRMIKFRSDITLITFSEVHRFRRFFSDEYVLLSGPFTII